MIVRRKAAGLQESATGERMETCDVAERGNYGRAVWVGIVLAGFLWAGLDLQTVWAGEATEAMKGTIDEVLRILADKDLKQPAKANERRQLLEKAVGERFDYYEMSRRSLGAPWANLPDKDKEEFVSLFQTLFRRGRALHQRADGKRLCRGADESVDREDGDPARLPLAPQSFDLACLRCRRRRGEPGEQLPGAIHQDSAERQLRRFDRPAPQEIR
jgi:hypothetical protein